MLVRRLRARLYDAVMGLPAMVVTELAAEHGYEGPLSEPADVGPAADWLWERALVGEHVLIDLDACY